jgi:hypothetical protein
MPRIASGWSAAVQSAADRAGMSASRWDRHTRIVRRLHLMADYECHPRLESQEEGLHNVDPFELAIPEQLAQALTEWGGPVHRVAQPVRPHGVRVSGQVGGERVASAGGPHSRRSFEARGSTPATSTRGTRPELVAANE